MSPRLAHLLDEARELLALEEKMGDSLDCDLVGVHGLLAELVAELS